MSAFDDQLARLKLQLGMKRDIEVAAVLGLGRAALSDRKKRGTFPMDRVTQLAASRPDLNLDMHYILTGESKAFGERLDQLRAASKAVAGLDIPDALRQPVRDIIVGVAYSDSRIVMDAIRQLAETSPVQRYPIAAESEPTYTAQEKKP